MNMVATRVVLTAVTQQWFRVEDLMRSYLGSLAGGVAALQRAASTAVSMKRKREKEFKESREAVGGLMLERSRHVTL